MAKSSRSKWKKLHKRQRAQEVAAVVQRRVSRLNDKLRLAAEGGLGAVPMQDPETRFHFVNPEVDMNVPQNCKGLNNNFQDIMQESLDFSRPLQLQPPRTNFHGKSDPNAPHPMTQQFELLDASAPVAGHAITVKDVERMAVNEEQEQCLNVDHLANEEEAPNGMANEDGVMEEFVFGCNDAAEETTANTKALLFGASDAAAVKKKQKSKMAKTPQAVPPQRICSMAGAVKNGGRLLQVSGNKKAKRLSNALSTRLVKSGSRAARKRVTASHE
ncbi:hypothetical protein MOQ_005875 [Trypanosoma cruzi marinkellei]|uniref:Uncharacterized protein n=1 Tax=Trypanosoma cruzi marinkellei TaxID=85056 RepID=K2M5X3_TRYCR|nr:hypothetical protein MOQ_005875 [Trypanosoma cruzi marinkellei]